MARSARERGPAGQDDPEQPEATDGRRRDADATASADEVESTVPAGKPGAPPIPWRRNLYAVWAAQLLAIVGFSLRVPFLPFYLADLGVATPDGQALWSGLINAAGAGVMAISAPIWGVVADRRGRRPMLLRATFAATVTVGLMGLATQPWHLLALRLVEGAMTGTVTAATALVATTTPRGRLGYALGMVSTAVFAGSSLGPLFGGVLADRIGPRPTFAVASACLGTAGLIVLFLVRERFVPAPRRPPTGGGRLAGFRAATGSLLVPGLLSLIVVLFAVRLASMAVQPIVPLFVQQLAPDTADPSSLSGLVLGVLGLTSAVSAVFLGRLGDRRGHRRILFAGVLAAGLLYLPMAAAQNPWQLVLWQALFGVAAGGIVPAANAIVANLSPPERRGAVFGLTAAAGSLGGFVGPLLGGALGAVLGLRAPFFATALLLLALAAGIARGATKADRRPESS
jgi:MFS transporter, DHA1 family, multidrug resistance protein